MANALYHARSLSSPKWLVWCQATIGRGSQQLSQTSTHLWVEGVQHIPEQIWSLQKAFWRMMFAQWTMGQHCWEDVIMCLYLCVWPRVFYHYYIYFNLKVCISSFEHHVFGPVEQCSWDAVQHSVTPERLGLRMFSRKAAPVVPVPVCHIIRLDH